MTFWQIRHKETGLFFGKGRGEWTTKDELRCGRTKRRIEQQSGERLSEFSAAGSVFWHSRFHKTGHIYRRLRDLKVALQNLEQLYGPRMMKHLEIVQVSAGLETVLSPDALREKIGL